MKKSIIIFIISALVLITSIIWLINTKTSGSFEEILMISGIIIVVGFALFRGFATAKSAMNKEPVEDELSKKIMTKSSSLSFYISIYFWLFMMYISDKVKWETHTQIGAGIMGMAIIFVLSWLFVKFKGSKNE